MIDLNVALEQAKIKQQQYEEQQEQEIIINKNNQEQLKIKREQDCIAFNRIIDENIDNVKNFLGDKCELKAYNIGFQCVDVSFDFRAILIRLLSAPNYKFTIFTYYEVRNSYKTMDELISLTTTKLTDFITNIKLNGI